MHTLANFEIKMVMNPNVFIEREILNIPHDSGYVHVIMYK